MIETNYGQKQEMSYQCTKNTQITSKLRCKQKHQKKLQNQLMAIIKKEKHIQFLFSNCLYISVIKLNIEWQIAFLAVKKIIYSINEIDLLSIFYWVK